MTTGESGREGRERPVRGARSDRAYFLLVVGLAFVFLAIVGYPRQWSLGLLINDEFWYAHLARNLYEGMGYVSNVMYPVQAPQYETFPVPEAMKQSGFSLLSAAIWQITGISVRAMLVVAAAGLSLFSGLSFLLARQLGWERPASLAVAAAVVVNPVVAQYGVQALPEALYFSLFVLVVWLLLRGGTADILLAAVAHAVLIIIKGHGIIYIPVLLAYLWLRGAQDLRRGLRPDARKARTAATYIAVLFATLMVANLALPTGSVALFQSGGTYSYAFLSETGRAISALPYLDVEPADVAGYILEHPAEYLEKVARQIRRTKIFVDDLGAPALSGVLFPLLSLSLVLLLVDALAPGVLLPTTPESRREREPYLLFAVIIAATFAFFWSIYVVTRFVTHPLPLMLLLTMYVLHRLAPLAQGVSARLRTFLVAAAALYFLAYPAAVTVWGSYRYPMEHIGSQLAVRFLDYARMADNVRGHLPDDPVLVSDMAHEITWFTGARTILFPNSESDLKYLVDRYDVDALYEHPLFPRDWPWIRDEFILVDDADGKLWVRRRDQ